MTMISRRTAVIGSVAALGVAACQPAATILSVTASASANANPGPGGGGRPLTLTVVQMSGTGAFDSSDFFALQDPTTALGAEFIGVTQLVLPPGGSAATSFEVRPGAAAIGFIAGYRDPSGKVFRRRIPAPSSSAAVSVSVTASGVSV
ncbi:MAG: type VI secretion system lipoprotein TssJ [Pseudomonadota bacterium]